MLLKYQMLQKYTDVSAWNNLRKKKGGCFRALLLGHEATRKSSRFSRLNIKLYKILGFPGGSDSKESACRETWVQSLG